MIGRFVAMTFMSAYISHKPLLAVHDQNKHGGRDVKQNVNTIIDFVGLVANYFEEMATILNNTTSKGAGNYIGETKQQLRDGRIVLFSK